MNFLFCPRRFDALRLVLRAFFQLGFPVILSFLSALTSTAHAEPKPYTIGPAPKWVAPVALDLADHAPVAQTSQGVHYLLTDTQVSLEEGKRVIFRRLATKALDDKGVESTAHIEIRFDPAYESLALHSIDVYREKKKTSRLGGVTVRVLQREKELEYRIYDGSKTANVFLEDIRAGDIVEYAYSIRGTNPVFADRFFGRFELQWRAPVHQQYARLLWPAARKIFFTNRNTTIKPATRDIGALREYVWEKNNVPPLSVEDNAPDWFDPYPVVQWGEFSGWGAVAKWAVPLYQTPATLNARLLAEVARIAGAQSSPEDRLMETLHFVQREIRYLGVEIGPGSHAPSAPGVVLERRFGDCKDKALLTVTLLRALGVAASPALVNTKLERSLGEWQANPGAFNHVIVRARVNGRDYWVDPTHEPQLGGITALVQPNFGYALVVDPASHELSRMPDAALTKQAIHSVFNVQAGLNEPVQYRIVTVYEGDGAERMRSTLASSSREELQKKYLNFYALDYPDIAVVKPLKSIDDGALNKLTTEEHYVIRNFWKPSAKGNRSEMQVLSPEVSTFLARPKDLIRTSPLPVRFPFELTHVTEVQLPEKWDIKNENLVVDDPAFRFEHLLEVKGNVIVLTDRVVTKADHVLPADTARYAANLKKAYDEVGITLYGRDATALAARPFYMRVNWPITLLAIMFVAGAIWLAWCVDRYDPPAAVPPGTRARDFGGWLVLPAISVTVTPFKMAYELWDLLPAYAPSTWDGLTTVGEAAYHPLWAPLMIFVLAFNIVLLVMSGLLIYLMFKKRSNFPRVWVAVMGTATVVAFLDLWFTQSIPQAASGVTSKDWAAAIRGLLAFGIWGTYLLVSKRVAWTFVNTRRAAAADESDVDKDKDNSEQPPQPAGPVEAMPQATT